MWDTLLSRLVDGLPGEVRHLLQDEIAALVTGSFDVIFKCDKAQSLLKDENNDNSTQNSSIKRQTWSEYISERLVSYLSTTSDDATSQSGRHEFLLILGYSALLAFLQSNCTGPPLDYSSAEVLLGPQAANNRDDFTAVREQLVSSLSIDGVAAYRLTPNVELLCLARTIFSNDTLIKSTPLAVWARLRTNYTHQRLLSEPSATLQEQILEDLDLVDDIVSADAAVQAEVLLERASIETHYANDKQARQAINEAAKLRHFDFALTGRLGKRTKFQQRDTSQLVVLARSHDPLHVTNGTHATNPIAPKKLDLNDDTLLEAISFSDPTVVTEDVSLPASLTDIDPSDQPRLDPQDSIILLSLASAITNISPADGLTREETLPYATRVLDGGSSNWQIYTQALLVRSRVEGYKSRTIERGLLQLQALVDQVIVETTGTDGSDEAPTSFLPQSKESESAPATERLKYVFQLAPPARWDLEAELAQRWVALGGLRSALEIYERLEMWAEAALCWAATEREDKAKAMIRKMLYLPSDRQERPDGEEKWEGAEREHLPADAPRLFCILGDIDQDASMYERAWEVSGQHYARAQRSLGRMYFTAKDYLRAAAAYSRSLHVNRLNHGSWFALGCALLEIQEYEKAIEAFTRCVQLDERDAEAWSNLAAALLRRPTETNCKSQLTVPKPSADDEEEDALVSAPSNPQKSKEEALRALKRAAALKHDSFQIWENVMIVSASLDPPESSSAIAAQGRVIDLRGPTVGERCIDPEIMTIIVRSTIAGAEQYDASKPGPERMLVELFDRKIQPLITASATLWGLVAKLAIWRKRPASALDAHEKAWRSITTQPGWETDSERRWDAVVDSTIELCDAYESLGPMETTEGLAAGQALVAKDWKFKSRSAIRGILGRGRNSFEDTPGWTRLQEALENLKG